MESDNRFDDIFRSAIEPESMEPSEKSWTSLKEKLDQKRAAQKKKSRRRGLWLFSLVVLISAFSVYEYVSLKKSSPQKYSQSISPVVNQDIKTSQDNDQKSVQDKKIVSDENPSVQPESNFGNTDNSSEPGENNIPSQAEINSEDQKESSSESAHISPDSNKPLTTELKSKKRISEKKKNQSLPAIQASSTSEKSGKPFAVSRADNPSETGQANYSDEKKSGRNQEQSQLTAAKKANDTKDYSEASQPVNQNSENSTSLIAESTNNSDVSGNNDELSNSSVPDIKSVIADTKSDQGNTSSIPVLPDENSNSLLNNSAPSAVQTGSSKSDSLLSIVPDTSASLLDKDYFQPEVKDTSKSLAKKIMSRLSAEAYFSPDYVSKRVSDNIEYTGPEISQTNNFSEEKAAFSYSTGIRLQYDISDKFSFTVGGSFSKYSFTGEFSEIAVITDSAYREGHGHGHQNGHGHGQGHGGGHGGGGGGHGGGGHGGGGGNPGGNHEPPHYVIQTSCGAIDLQNTPPNFQHQNGNTIAADAFTEQTISFINIPITLRYKFNRPKFTWYTYLGAAANLVQSDVVKVNIDNTFSETNDIDGLRSVNYTGLFGIGSQYKLGKGLSIFLEPNIRYSLSPINESNPVNSYPYFIGISAGVSYHFH